MIASHLSSAFSVKRRPSLTRQQAATSRSVFFRSVTPRSRRRLAPLPLLGLLMLLLVIGSSLGAAGTASALQTYKQVSFYNQTTRTILLAVVMKEESNCGSDGWHFSGWWTLDPLETGEFSPVIGSSFYYHAHTYDGTVWDGVDGVDEQITLYASRSDFDWCQYDTDDWLNLYGGGVVDTAAEGYQITLGNIDLTGETSVNRNLLD